MPVCTSSLPDGVTLTHPNVTNVGRGWDWTDAP